MLKNGARSARNLKNEQSMCVVLKKMSCRVCLFFSNFNLTILIIQGPFVHFNWRCRKTQPVRLSTFPFLWYGGPVTLSYLSMTSFVQNNPEISIDSIFVDNFSSGAYEKMGFGYLFENKNSSLLLGATSRLKAPTLTTKQWWSYFKNVGKLAPVPEDLKFGEVPQAVLRLGGTFVVNDDMIMYSHADTVPGDHPNIEDVLKAAISKAD